jgi:hypothetical protein
MLVLNVELAVVPDTDLVPLRDVLQQRIIRDASEKLGIQMPLRVNITVRSVQADERKIAKKARKGGAAVAPEETSAPEGFEDATLG